MGKIGFIGDKFSIEVFKSTGADIFPAESIGEAIEIIEGLNLEEYECIYLTEELYDEKTFYRYIKERKITIIPSLKSSKGKGYQIVERLIRKATGVREK